MYKKHHHHHHQQQQELPHIRAIVSVCVRVTLDYLLYIVCIHLGAQTYSTICSSENIQNFEEGIHVSIQSFFVFFVFVFVLFFFLTAIIINSTQKQCDSNKYLKL